MIVNLKERKISFEKELNSLDFFTLDFCSVLDKLNINYVLISGYVSIIFGRNRSSEDIDIFIDTINLNKFEDLWNELNKSFECITTKDKKEAYNNYLNLNTAVRFSKINEFIPNMEVKFIKNDFDKWALKNRVNVKINNRNLFVSPLELQISFKLFLGSEKDIEDAKFLYVLFNEELDCSLLEEFNKKLKTTDLFNMYIK